ncbi:apoptosis regulatory protein Siva isoform X1 [Helicoverpa armigera]|uniref:apoptosis regulatory protein Siva isoform X1 n=1 Tax=Helicoverpa armigera TaxID=29058 RepID=UPI000B396220|nr:apoptosis regulatory protein Siva isoform X1 [Helicoverpa armigera]
MAKRSNPFIEDFVQQSKIHVGMKQFNNNEDKLKKVYERTLLLLFKGAKKCPPVIISEDTVNTSEKQGKMKQLFIGKDGGLMHSGSMKSSLQVQSMSGIKQCSCGSKDESQCAYCEVSLCCDCQHMCIRCERQHCACCTMIGSEGAEVCVSCYS